MILKLIFISYLTILSQTCASIASDELGLLLTRGHDSSESSGKVVSAAAAAASAASAAPTGIFESLDNRDMKALDAMSLRPDFSERLHEEQVRLGRILLLEIDISSANREGQGLAYMLASRGALDTLTPDQRQKLLLLTIQRQHLTLFDYMMECGYETNVKDEEDPKAPSVTMIALLGGHETMFLRLLRNGANPDYGNTDMTLFQAAARQGADWAVGILMSAKADSMKVTEAVKDSPFHIALGSGDYTFVKALRGHSIIYGDDRIETILKEMNLAEDPELFVESTMLHLAMDRNDERAFEALRDAGASVSSQPLYEGQTLALRALYSCNFQYIYYFCKFYNLDLSVPFSRVSVDTMLGAAISLEEGITIDAEGTVPVHAWDIIPRSQYMQLVNLSAEFGFSKPIDHFKKRGFDVNFLNPDGTRPIHKALANGQWAIVSYYCAQYPVEALYDAERKGFGTFVPESFHEEWAALLRTIS